jgi:hypothetical protein
VDLVLARRPAGLTVEPVRVDPDTIIGCRVKPILGYKRQRLDALRIDRRSGNCWKSPA